MSKSPFDGSGFTSTNPRKKDRPCRHCRRLIDHHSPHVICGNCHANRMARRDEDDDGPASLSQGS